MSKYVIVIEEEYKYVIPIEAISLKEAKDIVNQKWLAKELDDYCQRGWAEITAEEAEGEGEE